MQKKKLKHKGKVYLGVKKGGKVNVSIEKTAKQQLISLGIYNIETDTWQDICKGQKVPDIVKKGFALTFGVGDTDIA